MTKDVVFNMVEDFKRDLSRIHKDEMMHSGRDSCD